jgi:hypothetical protein
MNKRIKEIIVLLQNNQIVYADTNLNTFFKVMRALEPTTPSKDTLKRRLYGKNRFYFFTNELGTPYQICRYENPNYVGLKKNH